MTSQTSVTVPYLFSYVNGAYKAITPFSAVERSVIFGKNFQCPVLSLLGLTIIGSVTGGSIASVLQDDTSYSTLVSSNLAFPMGSQNTIIGNLTVYRPPTTYLYYTPPTADTSTTGTNNVVIAAAGVFSKPLKSNMVLISSSPDPNFNLDTYIQNHSVNIVTSKLVLPNMKNLESSSFSLFSRLPRDAVVFNKNTGQLVQVA